ncbi:unnamed protein product [Clonostachys rosea f. rosea IK726]|jgi:hypothetical protein|uniref:Uncharacterized protein n=1 Tax=Clonostachys rosea f. rosea IK726 TaxID=1349383 RepID=A0ACA9TL63_BIOOC|nr:unnamed protein product [Clonostachys rosea f. rosea IK726]
MTSLSINMFRVSLLALLATTTMGLPNCVSLVNLPLLDKAFTPCYLNAEASLMPRGETQTQVSGGIIGGAVAGSVVGLAIIALGIFLVIRHQTRSNAMSAASESEELPRTSSTTKFPEHSYEMSPIGQQYPPSEAYNVPQELYGSEPVSHEHRASPIIVFELDASERR